MLSQKKNKGNPIANNINFTEHIRSFVNAFSDSQTAKKQIIEAYQKKRDRPVSITELPVYNFSRYSLVFLHLVSLIFACSFVFYLASLGLSKGIFIIISLITILILIFCEYGQHATLQTFFNIKFINGLISQRLVILAIIFSTISITSSSFGINQFFISRNIESIPLWYALIFITILVELFILLNTYDVHRFEYRAKNEVTMLNDMYYKNGVSTIFIDNPPPNLPSNSPTLPTATAQKPSIVVQPPYKRTRTSADADSNKQARKTASKQTGKQNKQDRQTIGFKQPEKPVKTDHIEEKQDVKVWSNTEILNQLNIYQKRIAKQGDKVTEANRVGEWFFNSIKDKEQHPYITPQERAKLYKTHLKNLKNKVL